jgi:ribosomal protein L33
MKQTRVEIEAGAMVRSRATFCHQCNRHTEYLFAATRLITLLTGWRKGGYPYTPRIPIYHQFLKIVLVCQRCRPPSNLEKKEILEEGKYKGQSLELRSRTP